jgi:hypothetical protein
MKGTNISLQLESMEFMQKFPFALLAFVKVAFDGGPKIVVFEIPAHRDLTAFIESIIKPVFVKDPRKITALNFRFASFHQKESGILTMESNPVYLISYSLKSGFFEKSTDKKANAA